MLDNEFKAKNDFLLCIDGKIGCSFLKNLALVYDALEKLKSTSEFLQLVNVTLAKAVHVISRLISIFEGRKFGGGPSVF